jgi:hypothetical protein
MKIIHIPSVQKILLCTDPTPEVLLITPSPCLRAEALRLPARSRFGEGRARKRVTPSRYPLLAC